VRPRLFPRNVNRNPRTARTGGTSVVGLLIENPLGCKSYESFTLNVNPNGIASLSPAISKPAVNPK